MNDHKNQLLTKIYRDIIIECINQKFVKIEDIFGVLLREEFKNKNMKGVNHVIGK